MRNKTLATLLTAGMIFLHPQLGSYIMIGSDTNGNGYEDTRKIYMMIEQYPDGTIRSEHLVTMKDWNGDRRFTEDEVTWKLGDIEL